MHQLGEFVPRDTPGDGDPLNASELHTPDQVVDQIATADRHVTDHDLGSDDPHRDRRLRGLDELDTGDERFDIPGNDGMAGRAQLRRSQRRGKAPEEFVREMGSSVFHMKMPT